MSSKNKNEENEKQTMGAEIILTVPEKTRGKRITLRGWLDNGTSESLIDHKKLDKDIVN